MQQTDIKNQIWRNLDRLRADPSFRGCRDTRLLELIGATLGVEKLDSLFQSTELISKLANAYSIVAPIYVLKFIEKLLEAESKKSIFDPWLTASSPVFYIQADDVFGTCIDSTEFETIKSLFEEKSQNIKLDDTLDELSKTTQGFDLVLSFPPFGRRMQDVNGEKSPFDFTTTLLLKCGERLAQDGKLIFLVPNSFLWNEKGKEALNKQGLFVDAVFSIPSGAFSPMTSIQLHLILISKQNKEKTFVAEISQDDITNKTILQNFKNQKQGRAIQLGCLVDFLEFESLNALIAEKEMQELVKRIGYPPTLLTDILLTDISESINVLKGDNADEVEHLANSIYLPKIGSSPVVASLSELKIQPKNYYQIQLDETKANAIYVANYFNTPIGKKSRESLEAGVVIPRILKSQLSKCVLFLPDLPTQAEVIEVDSKIQQFTLRLDELRRNLWKQPKSYNSISKELKTINQEEKLENWIDELPFPISSILWRYYATKDNSKKIEHLFHFFEGFSEFLSMLMLSALVQDKEFYKAESHNWVNNDEKFQDWYLRATFGNWNALTSKLSKAIRKYVLDKDSDRKDYCKSLFGNPTEAFLSMITSKSIVRILGEVADLRNKWKGHGGITSEEENNQRVLTLEQKLNEFRTYIADAFEDTRILSPTTSSFEDGIFTFNAKELIGARTPFNEITVKSLIPLDRKKLYLRNSGQTKPLELLPFIKFVEASNAIYFYTSIESKDVRWISYHFEKEAELKQPVDDQLFKVFDLLKP
ncbi:N-6 DNA methylase [Limnothrix sp. FACHB-881]|uniref:N-6 DNA methylase n=1 Tax=Limnothrix sp. FACHB-881 TaxID=2692819 RepID=UPI0016844F31|nr:N-6 DNA methylase [Limnothrix sp. FACHB-881]MBD2635797.1 N-6 DNA methylase [Limnothrix sp. FACHB-881]